MAQEKEDTKKKKPKSQLPIYIGLAVLLSIALPYVYWGIKINIYLIQHPKEGFTFVQIRDFWKVVVGALVTQFVKY